MWHLCRAHVGWGTMVRPNLEEERDQPWMRRARRLHASREMNLTPTSRARRKPWKTSASLLVACALSAPGSASAYTIENAFSTGCHEQITSQALRTVRTEVATAAPLALTDNEQALVDDLQFTPEGDMKDLGAVTLLVSVRDNDLKGRGSGDLTELAEIHGDPGDQREHCLRGPGQKEPGGSAAAVADCRAFIRERVLASLEGLDGAGRPDVTKRTSLAVHLSIRGRVDASLPTYYVRVGQAIHAVEDSFTHTYWTPDGMQITVALDWLDSVNTTLVESRDGPAHAAQLDRCDDPDELRKRRRELAIEASTGILRATLDPQKTKDQKMAAVDVVLDKYLTYKPGCTSDNSWCNAPESQYKANSGCGCRVGTAEEGLGAAGLAVLAGLFMVGRRARRRRTAATLTAAIVGLSASAFTPAVARAQTESSYPASAEAPPEPLPPTVQAPSPAPRTVAPAATPAPAATNEHAPPPPTVTPVKEPGPKDPTKTAWGAYAGISGSIDKAALAGAVGARVRASNHWAFGLDGEWNPWLALNGTPVRRGVINVYGTAILRFPLAYENFNLRSSLSLGGSYLLTNLYGAPSGSVGIYFGLSPLGLEWKASRAFYLIVNPINLAVPVPQLSGVPLLYPQYRLTVGLEFYAG